MNSNTQGNYEVRRTNNYLDLVEGRSYHATPITFAEFLTKPESLFFYEDTFFQIPGYIQQGAEIQAIEEAARKTVIQYIIDEFEDRLLGMQNYVRWAKLFKNRCDSLCPSFWAQVNMIDLMFAKDLEMDQNEITRSSTGNRNVTGTGSTVTEMSSETNTIGHQENVQDIDNTQSTDTSTREANATVVRADDQLESDLQYDWSDAADNVHEIRNRAGDSHQHMESQTDTTTNSSTDSESKTTRNDENTAETSDGTANEIQDVTNKQFMRERQWAIQTARDLLPLEWLTANLRGMFYLLY